MRILIVHNSYTSRGGEDVVVENEIKLLQDKKHKVEHLFFKNSKKQPLSFKLKLVWNIFYNSASAKALQSKIKSFKPDIIHVHNFFYQASPSVFFIAKRYKVPVVMTLHNYRLICINGLLMQKNSICELCVQKKTPFAGIKHKCYGNSLLASTLVTMMNVWHRYRKTWQSKVDKYIMLTDFAKQKLLHSALGLEENQIAVKPNFVEDLGFTTSAKRENYYVFVGRLSKEKGIDILLDALELFDFRVKIFGEGELQASVEEKAKHNPNLDYSGFQTKDQILAALKKSKALLFPSIWYEGLPMTILEAFSTGTPVLASDIGNVNQIVGHNHNGLHFRKASAEDMVEKIKVLNENFSNLSYLYENARQTYLDSYTPEKTYKGLMKVYRSTVKK